MLLQTVFTLLCLLVPCHVHAATSCQLEAQPSPVATTAPPAAARSEARTDAWEGRDARRPQAEHGTGWAPRTYDVAGQKTLVENSLGAVTLYQLNDVGQVVSIVEDWIRVGDGPRHLEDKRFQMREAKYKVAGGCLKR
jgi:hypothetical protein